LLEGATALTTELKRDQIWEVRDAVEEDDFVREGETM